MFKVCQVPQRKKMSQIARKENRTCEVGMSEFGDSVRWRRKAVGMRQAELAAKIRRRHRPTTASYISRIESGDIDPRLSTVAAIARALHVKTWQLVAGFEQPFWGDYLCLTPLGKREVQRMIDWQLERRG